MSDTRRLEEVPDKWWVGMQPRNSLSDKRTFQGLAKLREDVVAAVC